jgi:hypothetical protein
MLKGEKFYQLKRQVDFYVISFEKCCNKKRNEKTLVPIGINF